MLALFSGKVTLASTALSVGQGILNVTLAGGASIIAGTNNSGMLTLSGTMAEINAALATLTYQGKLNFTGTDNLQVFTSDLGFTGSGGVLTDSANIVITVNPVNDAPVNAAPAAQTVYEDTPLNFSGANAISVSDVDGGAVRTQLTVTLIASDGTLNLAGVFGLTFSVGSGTADGALTFQGTLVDINAALNGLSFSPTADFNGSASLRLITSDLGNTGTGGVLTDSDSIAITVTEVNDAPVAVNDILSAVAEDSGTRIISYAALAGNDSAGPANESAQNLTITGVANALGGSVSIVDGAVHFNLTPDFHGTTSFEYTVADDGTTNGASDFRNAVGSASFSVTSVNDIPLIGGVASGTVTEDAALLLTTAGTLTISDIDSGESAFEAQTATAGTYGTFTIDASGAWAYSAVNNQLAIQQLANGATLAETFFAVSVDGTAKQDVVITILSANDAPLATDLTFTIADTAHHVFTTSDFGYTDTEGDALAKILVTSLPAKGTLVVDTAPVAVNQEIAATDISTGKFIFIANTGTPTTISTSFNFQVSDGTAYSALNYSIFVVIEPGPVSAPAANSTPSAAAPDVVTPVTTDPAKTTTALSAAASVAPVAKPAVSSDLAFAPVTLLGNDNSSLARAATESTGDTQQTRSITGGGLLPINLATFTLDSSTQFNLEALKSAELSASGRIAFAISSPAFTRELDRLRNNNKAEEVAERNIILSSVTAGAGMSVGYVLWLLRGGLLITSLLSSLPAWRFVDPLPVMGRLKGDGEDDDIDDDGDSIESMVSNESDATKGKRDA